jgi:hypothetical protein
MVVEGSSHGLWHFFGGTNKNHEQNTKPGIGIQDYQNIKQ